MSHFAFVQSSQVRVPLAPQPVQQFQTAFLPAPKAGQYVSVFLPHLLQTHAHSLQKLQIFPRFFSYHQTIAAHFDDGQLGAQHLQFSLTTQLLGLVALPLRLALLPVLRQAFRLALPWPLTARALPTPNARLFRQRPCSGLFHAPCLGSAVQFYFPVSECAASPAPLGRSNCHAAHSNAVKSLMQRLLPRAVGASHLLRFPEPLLSCALRPRIVRLQGCVLLVVVRQPSVHDQPLANAEITKAPLHGASFHQFHGTARPVWPVASTAPIGCSAVRLRHQRVTGSPRLISVSTPLRGDVDTVRKCLRPLLEYDDGFSVLH